MKNKIRSVNRIIDGGGPLVFWDDDNESRYKKGFFMDFSVCDNPECLYAHFWVLDIDERFKNFELSEDGKLSYQIDNEDKEALPNTLINGNIHVDTAEITINQEGDLKKDSSDLFARFSMNFENTDLIEIIRKRWRYIKKTSRDSWRKRDWTWWKPGEMVAWFDVYPDEPDMILENGKYPIIADDMYCITPGCTCNDIVISFVKYDKKKHIIGGVNIDLLKWRICDIQAKGKNHQRLRDLWEGLNEQYPDLKKTIKKRRKDNKKIGGQIAQMSRNMPLNKITAKKIRRNAPCPCGSGKKYKKCCMK